jgi:hypothetical protein
LFKITEINYSRKRERKNNYGAGGEPVSYGLGNFTYEGDITLFVDEIQNILQTAPNRSILEIPPFTITVIFSGSGVPTTTHKLLNVTFTEDPFAAKQNDSALPVKVSFVYAGLGK